MATPIRARSAAAQAALAQVERWQARFAAGLDALHPTAARPAFAPVSWLRDAGTHGGGTRLVCADSPLIQRGSVNVSQVHYDDLPDKALASATALSTIIHPQHPHAPSVHIHVSWTELRSGRHYWRLMADLNPAIAYAPATQRFAQALEAVDPALYPEARARGDRYFFIPALDRHRGVTHYYLESWCTDAPAADAAFADRFACAAIDTYCAILSDALAAAEPPTADDLAAQRAYHTLYLFQVLTLDRGTTSGLLVHDQNDVGIMGSLPARVDPALLEQWRAKVPSLQQPLVDGLVEAVRAGDAGAVDEATKRRLAQAVRAHYQRNPDALALQASGGILPPTVANHR